MFMGYFSVGCWLFLASYLEMPVSTTHSCVGGMIGMAMMLKGNDCVIWYKPVETFPYVGGVGGIKVLVFISYIFWYYCYDFICCYTSISIKKRF